MPHQRWHRSRVPGTVPGARVAGGSRPSPSRRLAAAVALLCAAAALAVVLEALADRPIALPVSIVAVAVTLLAGWAALVGRGSRRAMATLVAAVAFGGLIAFAGAAGLVTVFVTAALLAASGVAARGAFGRHRPSGTRVGPARHGVLFVNTRSGGGAAGRHNLAEEAGRRGVAVVPLTPNTDLRSLAEKAVADGADVIGIAGGDGSQALVADVARRHDIAFVCVPAGTRNHFALDLGLDRRNVAGALDAFGEAVERRVDLGQVGGRVFVNNVSLGVYAEIVQSDSYRNAKAGTAAAMLPDLLGPGRAPPDLRFTGPDGQPEPTADVLLVSNNAYQLHSLGGLGTRPRLDGGNLGVTALRVDRAQDVPTLVALESVGALDRFHGFHQWTSQVLRVDAASPTSVGVDGEALRLTPPLVFSCLPAALRVRLPPQAPGVPPLRPRVCATPSALLHIAAGRPGT
ncbi:diacylglycerol kinase [Frankia sp. Cpl3]|uniref:diacylglycerol/lipid kinase family protein n=1 Tax=Parafrankia colletiae TaxID=573497 RepID=UPI000A06CB09|nr:diacylglycerol kinase family protein [Parafrankia colletiae]MCK9899129.1 diacylglycerol kinase [Frankia sp. Cpl3]